MKKLKVMSVVGTRPEIIRLSRVFAKLDTHCDHTIVHTGQNYDYELNQIFYDDLEIREPDYFLNSSSPTSNAIETVSNIFVSLDRILQDTRPDAFLVLGDTNSCLSAIIAKKHKIPIFHMEAGNRCFDQRLPEEVNRKIVDHIADINLPYSKIAREYLLQEGLNPDLVIRTGSPMAEILHFYKNKISQSNILERLSLKEKAYFLVSAHREENIETDISFNRFIKLLNCLANDYELPVIVSTHPRTNNKIKLTGAKVHPLVSTLPPFGFSDYVSLQKSAKVVLSDSGTISEEASILNLPAINLREQHERPEAMEECSVIMAGFNLERVKQGISILEKQLIGTKRNIELVDDYGVYNVSDKIVRIIHSYTDYVNHVVWKRS